MNNGNPSAKTFQTFQALKFLSSTSLFLFPFLYFDSSVSFLQFHAWPSPFKRFLQHGSLPIFKCRMYEVAISKSPHKWVNGVILITPYLKLVGNPLNFPSTQGTSFRNDSRSLLQKHDSESQRPPLHSQPRRVPHNHEFLDMMDMTCREIDDQFWFESNLGCFFWFV